MPMEIVQSVDACVGITTALIRLTQIAIAYNNAGEIAKQIEATAKEARTVLRRTKALLEKREPLPPGHSLASEDARIMKCVHETARNCQDTIRVGIRSVFGKDFTTIESHWDKVKTSAHIAFHGKDADVLKADLQRDLTVFTTYLVLLQLSDSSVIRLSLKQSQHKILESMMSQHDLLKDLQARIGQIRELQSSQGSQRPSQDPQASDQTDSAAALPKTFSTTSMRDLEQSRRNAESAFTTRAVSTRKGSGESSQSSDVNMQSDATQEAQVQLEQNLAAPQEQPLPVSVLDRNIKGFRQEADNAQDIGDWAAARYPLEQLILNHREKTRHPGHDFPDQPDLEKELVNVLLRLSRWDEALERLDKAQSLTLDGHEPGVEQRPKSTLAAAWVSQLKALVLFDKFLKSESYRNSGLQSSDVVKASEAARRAFSIYHEGVSPTSSDERKEQFQESARLYATILHVADKEVDSQSIWDDAAHVCGKSLGPLVSRRDSAFEEDHQEPEGDDPTDFPPGRRKSASTKLVRAIRDQPEGLEEMVELYLADHPDENVDAMDEQGSTALHLAVKNGNDRVVELLSSRPDIDLDLRDRNGLTALRIAIEAERFEAINILGRFPASIQSRFSLQWTCLDYAIELPSATAASTLLATQHGAQLVEMSDVHRWTALHKCADKERPAHALIILQYSTPTSIDLLDGSGLTALDIALSKTPTTSSVLLIDHILDKHSVLDKQPRISASNARELDRHRKRRLSKGSTARRESSLSGRSDSTDSVIERTS